MKLKEIGFMIVIAVIVIGIILGISLIRGNSHHDEETMQCIADNSVLVVSSTCGHCANQKRILGENLDLFDIKDLKEDSDIVSAYNISHIPAWIINEQVYLGVHTVDELKQLTGC
jgi:hypothetical protein